MQFLVSHYKSNTVENLKKKKKGSISNLFWNVQNIKNSAINTKEILNIEADWTLFSATQPLQQEISKKNVLSNNTIYLMP